MPTKATYKDPNSGATYVQDQNGKWWNGPGTTSNGAEIPDPRPAAGTNPGAPAMNNPTSLIGTSQAGDPTLNFQDPNNFGYGGFGHDAQTTNNLMKTNADAMAARDAPVLQRTTGDWAGNGATAGQFANPAYQNQMQTRGQQGDYINSLQNDVNGGAPSLAQMQLKQGADMALQNQAAMAASGGPQNYAFAQRNAAQQGANTMQNLNMQQGQLRAQEHTAAQGMLGNALNQQRVSDLQATGMSYQNAIQQAQLEAGQNQTQAGLEAGQRGLNQQGQFAYLDMGQHAMDQDMAARMHYNDLMATKYANDRGLAQNAAQFSVGEQDKQRGAAMQFAAPIISKAMGG